MEQQATVRNAAAAIVNRNYHGLQSNVESLKFRLMAYTAVAPAMQPKDFFEWFLYFVALGCKLAALFKKEQSVGFLEGLAIFSISMGTAIKVGSKLIRQRAEKLELLTFLPSIIEITIPLLRSFHVLENKGTTISDFLENLGAALLIVAAFIALPAVLRRRDPMKPILQRQLNKLWRGDSGLAYEIQLGMTAKIMLDAADSFPGAATLPPDQYYPYM